VKASLPSGRKIKIGICEWAFPLAGPYSCKIAAALGLEGIELDLGSYEQGFPLANQVAQQAYREAGAQWGISFPSIAINALCAYGMTNPENSEPRKIALAAIHKGIDAAEALQIPIVQLPSFKDGEIKNETDFQLTAQCLKNACQYAKAKGIVIGTENVLAAEDNLRMLDEVGQANLKIFFDTQNPYLWHKYDVAAMIRKIGLSICEVHVKDGNGIMSGALLGKGESGFEQSLAALREINYSGWLHLENYYNRPPLNSGNEDPFELLKQDIGTLKEALIKLNY
jgi:sugar phosphate isomerase/epimerase